MPLVSVLVPTWNRLDYLQEAISSVLRQTYEHWELIVVDDRSDDGTREWMGTLGDDRIRLVALDHTGNLGHLRNRGITEAKGELVAFLDSDDAFEPPKISVQVEALRQHPECGWSYTAMTRVDEEGVDIVDTAIRWREISGWILASLLRFDALVDTPTVMVRRKLLDEVGPLDEDLLECQDYDLFFRLAAASQTVMIPEPLTRKRVHAGATSADRTRVNEAWIQVYRRFGERSPDPRVRSICRRQTRVHRLSAAVCRARRGEPGRAFAHVLPVLAARPWSPRTWRVLLGTVFVRGLLLGGAGVDRFPRSG